MKKNKLRWILAMVAVLLTAGVAGCTGGSDDLSAMEVARLMGNGINLGNTMEAYGRSTIGVSGDVSQYETFWGQPETTKEMIDGMKAAGFDTIRIPVAWTNMMDFENDDFTINPALLERVQQIVDWALEADMYVIVNDHWDGGWWGMFGSETEATRERAWNIYTNMWSQIADHFKSYPDKLIFESANEELGSRLNDRDYAADSGGLTEDECYVLTNSINQKFVDVVRDSGGKNKNRFLLIAGYNTDFYKTIDERYVMPTDTADDKLLLSVHYYSPWSYCGTTSQASWKAEASYELMNADFAVLTKFTDAGIPVVIGEYGALHTSDGDYKNNMVEYHANLLANCDLYNMVPMLWDTGGFYIKSLAKIEHEELAQLYLDNAFAKQKDLTQEEIIANAQAIMEAGLETGRANDEIAGEIYLDGSEKAIAWIMFTDQSWIGYSAGDTYSPSQTVDGLVATDVEINGAGTYTIGLDFTGTSNGCLMGIKFSAIGISNGELLFPGYSITIQEIKINGEPYAMIGKPYTASDDERCTRMNLVNEWVPEAPDTARTADGDNSNVVATVIDPLAFDEITSIEITFDYIAP